MGRVWSILILLGLFFMVISILGAKKFHHSRKKIFVLAISFSIIVLSVFTFAAIDVARDLPSSDPESVVQNQSFIVTANISCTTNNCNSINVTLFENQSTFFTVVGSTGTDEAVKVAQLSNGNIVAVGLTQSYGGSDNDPFQVIVNESGAVQYVTYSNHGSGSDYNDGVYATADGGFITCGTTNSLDATQGSFVSKFNSSGVEQWTITPNATQYNNAYDCIEDSEGNIVVVASLTEFVYTEQWIYKLDENGSMLWSSSLRWPDHNYPRTVLEFEDGYLVGAGQTSGGHNSLYTKYDANGSVDWIKSTDIATFDRAGYLALTDDGGFAAVGYYGASLNLYDILIERFNSSGHEQWSKTFGNGQNERARAVVGLDNGSIVVGGEVRDEDGTDRDAFLVKLDSSGNVVWGKLFNSSENESIYNLKISSDGGIIGTGYTESYGAGDRDVFIAKFTVDGELPGFANWSDWTPTLTDRAETETVQSFTETFRSHTDDTETTSSTTASPTEDNVFASDFAPLSNFEANTTQTQTISLNVGESYDVSWEVNATGPFGQYGLFVNATNTSSEGTTFFGVTITNESELELYSASLSPVNPYVSNNLTCSYSGVNEDGAIYAFVKNDIPVMNLYLPFEGNSSNALLDFSGNGNNIVSTSGTPNFSPTTGYDGDGAYTFDGSTEYFNISDDSSLDFTTEFTISFWVYPNSAGSGNDIVLLKAASDSDVAPYADYAIWRDTTDRTRWRMRIDSTATTFASDAITDDVWQHVVLTWNDSANNVSLYINGSYFDSQTNADTITGTSWPLIIGANADGAENWDGRLDDIRLYNQTLSAQQIRALAEQKPYLLTSDETMLDDVLYCNVTLFNSTSVTSIVQSNAVTVNPVPDTLTVNSVTLSTNGSNRNYSTEDVLVTLNITVDSIINITDWRVENVSFAPGNWPFDENVSNTTTGAIKDFSTYGYNLTLGGGSSARSPTFTTDCQIGGCYSFDGNDQYIANNITNFQENDTVGAIEAWIYLNSVAKSQYIWKVYDGDSVMSLAFHDTGDALYFWKQNSTFDGISARSNTAISVSTWTHVVGQYDGTDFVFFVNGVETGYNIASVGGGWLDTIGTTDTVVVGALTAGVDTLEFDGKIDQVMYYDKVLSSEQIYQNYRAGLEGHHIYNISYQQTSVGDNWSVAVTASDLTDYGQTIISSQIEIREVPPLNVSSVFLASSSNNNYTTENLSCSYVGTAQDGAIYTFFNDSQIYPILQLPFVGGSTNALEDFSENDFTVTETASPSYQSSGPFANYGAYDFNSDGDRLLISDSSVLSGMSELTISLWMNADSLPESCTGNSGGQCYQTIMGKSNWGSNREYRIRYNSNADTITWCVDTAAGSSCPDISFSDTYISTGTWHHLVGTWDGATGLLEMYLDGDVLATGDTSQTGTIFDGTSSLSIGSSADNGAAGSADDFNGKVGYVAIFDRVLTPEQISVIHTNEWNILNYNETSIDESYACNVTVFNATDLSTSLQSSSVTVRDTFGCNPVANQDWNISTQVVCDAATVGTGTGITRILSGGTLMIQNRSNVQTSGIEVLRTGDVVFIKDGSKFFMK